MRTDHDLASDPTFEPDRRPRRVLPPVLLALAVGALAVGAVVGLRGGAAQPAAVAAAPSGGEPAGGVATGTGTGQAPQDDGQPQDQDGDGDGGQEPEAKPAELVVGPDPVTLPVGAYGGSFTVANAGDEAMQWTAASKPSVTLSDSGGELSGGGENVVSFTVDEDTLEAGAFSFKIKVMGAGETVYVDVKGAKPIDVLKS